MHEFVIHKHKLTDRVCTLTLPLDFELLSFGQQDGELFIWEKHNYETRSTCARTFHIVYTGHIKMCDEKLKYLGTVLDNNTLMVYHLFMEDI